MSNRGVIAPPRQPDSENHERWRGLPVLLVGLALALGSHSLAEWILATVGAQWKKTIEALDYGFEHLGAVLVVAWVVRVAIENASHRQFLSVVNNKVRDQIEQSIQQIAEQSLAPLQESIKKLDDELGFTIRRPGVLDKESLEVLKNKVLSPTFIRTEYKLHLTLEPLSDSRNMPPDLIKVRTRVTHKVRNITKNNEKHRVESWIDAMFQPANIGPLDVCQFTRFICGPADSSDTPFQHFDLELLAREKRIVTDHGAVWLRHELQDGIPAETSYYVEVEATQVMRRTDLFVWSMGALTKGFGVSVGFSGGFSHADFQVGARELHHIGHEAFRDTFKEEKNVLSWSINQVLLPYQGVEIWWSPRQTGQQTGTAPIPDSKPHN